MENYSIRPLSSNQNGMAMPQSPPMQTFPGFEEEGKSFDARQFLGILQRRALVIAGVATIVMGIAAYSTLKEKPIYQGNIQLLVEPVNEDSTLGKVTVDNAAASKPILDYASQIQILKSPELMNTIVKDLKTLYPDITYDSLLQSLTINRLGDTKIIEVSYVSYDPSRIKVVLDKIAKSYLDYSLEKRKTKLRQGVKFVDQQLPSIKNRVDRLQRELQIFRQKYDFISPETEAGEITGRFSNLSTQRTALNQQLAISRANFASLGKEQGELAALNNAVVYQQLVGQLRQLDVQLSGESARFQADNPTIQTLEEKRQNILSLMQQESQRIMGVKYAEVATQLQSLEVQSQVLAQSERLAEQQAKLLPILSRRYTELQRDLQIATESLNRFLTTRETLQIQVAQTELPWELIKAAVQPQAPISPDISRNLSLGLVSSLVLGLGIGFLLEKADNTYHAVGSLKEDIKLPVLGILPFDRKLQNSQYHALTPAVPGGKTTVVNEGQEGISGLSSIFGRQFGSSSNNGRGKFGEALQVLFANIQLLTLERPIRSLVISSALPGDGKSTVAFQLAQTSAAMGKRVLLVDADLRRPQLHNLSDLNNVQGLSSVISTNLPVDQVIQQMPGMNNLSVMTAGPILPDPTKLLSSEKMKQLMAYFHQSFDLVIYDVPCLVGMVDARLLAPYTDGMVLVVRLDKTDKSGLTAAQDSLKLSPANILGIVANGDKSKLNEINYSHAVYR
ncbi:polysaccharide biosynthesis tyrosine autokinase [Calothrix sp. PCC 7507]|uniref:GumC family protein n=1 Tax=Calothrix sp. PCC 7507 TaxID=99598 RepID=UPI0005A616A2|nr:polysaccharide biosynthesis tyrosine autokinase [Calothrix sp. PCC 7507]